VIVAGTGTCHRVSDDFVEARLRNEQAYKAGFVRKVKDFHLVPQGALR
jgi:hypothetical protein